jgi:amidase
MTLTGAFVPGPRTHVPGAAAGPLAGLSFAVKDLIDVAGVPTGGGNPDWPRFAPTPARHAWAVQTLLDAGASVAGKTITDEVSLGILGENAHDGTPLNPAAPGRVPGGSSSGSASAVAAKACDFALGTDTGGSVRVPSSFCGLYGIRPTHGRLDLGGMMSQAPSSDTTGWFARDAETFARVSSVMLDEDIPTEVPGRLLIATDAFAFADPDVAAALQPMVAELGALIGNVEDTVLAPPGLLVWAQAQRILQPYEAWQTFREWVDRSNPRFAFNVGRQLAQAAMIAESDRGPALRVRGEARAHMRDLLPPGAILCLPTTPFPAPLRGLPWSALDPLRARITGLAVVGGLTGMPQVSIPGAEIGGLPVGLSVIGWPGSDAALVAVARALAARRA